MTVFLFASSSRFASAFLLNLLFLLQYFKALFAFLQQVELKIVEMLICWPAAHWASFFIDQMSGPNVSFDWLHDVSDYEQQLYQELLELKKEHNVKI